MLLEDLRARIGAIQSQHPREIYSFSLLPEGMPKGRLIEIAGKGKTEMVIKFLSEQPGKAIAWIEEDFSLFPTAVQQRNLDLGKVLFIEGKKDSAWAAGVILRSSLFPFLVYQAAKCDERTLRRFQLLSEKSETTTLLLHDTPSNAWPISLHLEVQNHQLMQRKRK